MALSSLASVKVRKAEVLMFPDPSLGENSWWLPHVMDHETWNQGTQNHRTMEPRDMGSQDIEP